MKLFTKYLVVLSLIFVFPVNHTIASSKSDDKKVIHEKTFKISAGKKIVLNTGSGDIQITPWDKPEVYVKVIGNDNAADKYEYNFNATSEEITITAENKGGWSWFSNINLRFDIDFPS